MGSAILVGALLLPGAGASAAARPNAAVAPYGVHDYGGFRNILPPGTNGLVTAAQLGAYEANPSNRPPHNDDQLGMYSSLTTAAPNITAAQIPKYFKDATFGVRAAQVAGTESPEPGVTIVRDKAFGVPHIYGDSRAATMFGIGYATAEDRLFFIDVLRHAGQGDLAAFAGGANVSMDESVWSSEPYNHQDLVNQVQWGKAQRPYGNQIFNDATSYIDGINAYIAKTQNPIFAPSLLPAEYVALGKQPQPFSVEDIVSIATLVGGIFGKGGGGQLSNALLYQSLERRFGPESRVVPGSPELLSAVAAGHRPRRRADHSGFATFLSFNDPADPEAPTTERGRSFPYQTLPRPSRAVKRTIAMPDTGSVRYANVASGAAADMRSAPPAAPSLGLLAFPRGMSNALLISARHSASGHPLAVMGPQVSYFTPEILMEEDIHGPGIDADGAAFPGSNLYVQLGHGRDYAWSATSSGQNIVDTFAVPLCNPAGGAVALNSGYYRIGGHCVAMQTLTRQESWTPNLADSTPAGSVTLRTQRTAYGIVVARARIHGKPVAYTNLRSTYMHELDSAVGFYLMNNSAMTRSPADFMRNMDKVGYTFNWFYTDDKHIAYFNSGLNPVRAPHTDPLFPTWSRYAWRGLHPSAVVTPSSAVESQTPQSAHPQAVDQSHLTSWNNKQAPGYNDAATGQEFASVYRSQLLDNNIAHYMRLRHGKLTLADLINAMGNAGTQDLRGVEVLPYALQIIGHPRSEPLRSAVSELRAWVASGSHRINRARPGAHGNYQQSAAIRIMDAWWPLLVSSELRPVLGAGLLSQIEGDYTINDEPGHGSSGPHLGSSWDVGFYGVVQKDLRAALHRRVRGALNRVFCGRGSLRACRAALESSLRQAVAKTPAQVYPADGTCPAGDQMCSDSIKFRAIGAVSQPLIEWVNRPTFQQADEILGHGPR